MQILNDSLVLQYISLLDGKSFLHESVQYPFCKCIKSDVPLPNDAHNGTKEPFSPNMAELAAFKKTDTISTMAIYITDVTFFGGRTMAFILKNMLEFKDEEKKDVGIVEQYNIVLYKNLDMHPPCAHYMLLEYEELFHTNYFDEKGVWEYIIHFFNSLIDGSLSYGENEAFDLAFTRCLEFCICVLQINFEYCNKIKTKPLIMSLLNYNPERRTRMSEIVKLIDKLYNTGYDFKFHLVHLALLIKQMMNQ